MNKNLRLANESFLILHTYIAIFVIALITIITFNLDYQIPDLTNEVRPIIIKKATSYVDSESLSIEAKERHCYLLATIITPIILFLSLFLFYRYSSSKWSFRNLHSGLVIFSYFTILSIIILSIFLNIRFILYQTRPELYFLNLILPCLLLTTILALIYNPQKNLNLILIAISIILSVVISSYFIFDDYYIANYSHNFSPVAYPIVQTYLGKAPGIDFKSLYGLHPYFLQIALYIFPKTILTLSATLSLLFLISLLSIAFCIFSIVKNKLVGFIGFIALLYLQNFLTSGNSMMPLFMVFQYESIRLLFPALLLALIVIYFKNPSKKKYYSTLILFSLGTIWNFDTGIFAYITLVIALGYDKISREFCYLEAIKHLFISLFILLLTWLVFIVSLKIFYGQFPNLSHLFYGQQAAMKFGYSASKISAFGIWNLPVLIYIVGLILSIQYFLTKQNRTLQNDLVIVLTSLGIGSFSYFITHSHYVNILHCSYPALILLIIFADKFCQKNFTNKIIIPLFILPLIIISYFCSAFFVNIFLNNSLKNNFITNKYQNGHKTKPAEMQELEFIKNNLQILDTKKDILMINDNDLEFYFSLELEIKSSLDIVNFRHMFYKTEMDQLLELIKSKEMPTIIITRAQGGYIKDWISDEERIKLNQILLQNYKIFSKLVIDKNNQAIIYTLSPVRFRTKVENNAITPI